MMSNAPKDFGLLVRAKREECGESQRAFGKRVSLSQAMICRIEAGDVSGLSKERLIDIATTLGIDRTLAEKAKTHSARVLAYCGTAGCPVNLPYILRFRELAFRPQMFEHDASEVQRCGFCGEKLQTQCAGCGAAPVRGKARCPTCGQAYVQCDVDIQEIYKKDFQFLIESLRAHYKDATEGL